MKIVYHLIGFVVCILMVLLACSKDSDGDKPYEDPRFFGFMEAKVNGELKTWETASTLRRPNCVITDFPFVECDPCTDAVICGYLYSLPDVTETITIRWSLHEDWGCEKFNASYAIRDGDDLVHYSSREICDTVYPTTYNCHDVSFTISPVGNDIYRGTFSFVASDGCGGKQMEVTDGKFEIKSEIPICDIN